MASERVLVDTGPLVALLADDDAEHDQCVEQSRTLNKPFLTTWPVLTEAAWLLRDKPNAIPKLLGLLENGLVLCVDLDSAAVPAIVQLAGKYADISPQLADLSLVYVASREQIPVVFTLDRRDFTIYRNQNGQPFQLVPR